MSNGNTPTGLPTRLFLGFIAGFLATFIFHQPTLALLKGVGLAPFGPFSMAPTQPLGIPAVFSLALWGGVWGILFVLIDKKFLGGSGYWATAFIFGAIQPSLIALLIVLPLKGKPMGGGWHPPFLITVFLINGAWGIGTGLILRGFEKRFFPTRWK